MLSDIVISEIERLKLWEKELISLLSQKMEFQSMSFQIQDWESISNILSDSMSWKYIYYFEIMEPLTKTEQETFIKISKDIAISKQNTNSIETWISTILYVGSSKTIKRRFQEHSGNGSTKTYSLQLKYWVHPKRIILFRYAKIPTPHQEILQIIEDGLWNDLRPIFGKKWAK